MVYIDNHSFKIRKDRYGEIAYRLAKNASVRKDNKTGVRGVSIENNRYVAFWVNNDGKRCKKSFSIKKFGKELTFMLAVEKRKEMEILYGYLS